MNPVQARRVIRTITLTKTTTMRAAAVSMESLMWVRKRRWKMRLLRYQQVAAVVEETSLMMEAKAAVER